VFAAILATLCRRLARSASRAQDRLVTRDFAAKGQALFWCSLAPDCYFKVIFLWRTARPNPAFPRPPKAFHLFSFERLAFHLFTKVKKKCDMSNMPERKKRIEVER